MLKRFGITLSIITLTLISTLAMTKDRPQNGEPEWGYTGDIGPSHWGELHDDWKLCGDGAAQSPVNINTETTTEVGLVEIDFDYHEAALNIVNNGHTVQVNVESGSSISYNGITYDLLQFHFHAPSEHQWNEQTAAMEIHFVHQDRNSSNLAVVAILIGSGDGDNSAYTPIFDNLPPIANQVVDIGLHNLATLLPENAHFYTYQGSLTTPPCSEIVRWLVQDIEIALSGEQIRAFTELYDYNARPLWELGSRDLLHAKGLGLD